MCDNIQKKFNSLTVKMILGVLLVVLLGAYLGILFYESMYQIVVLYIEDPSIFFNEILTWIIIAVLIIVIILLFFTASLKKKKIKNAGWIVIGLLIIGTVLLFLTVAKI